MSTGGASCPNGHASGDPEWCDTCGAPMAGPSAAAVAAAPSPSPHQVPSSAAIAPVSCPHCDAMNAADNLFCESCGYDFTTGQAPEPAVAAVAPVSPTDDPSAAAATVEPLTAVGWVVIVEVDPAWHAIKGELADRALPSPSTSTVRVVPACVAHRSYEPVARASPGSCPRHRHCRLPPSRPVAGRRRHPERGRPVVDQRHLRRRPGRGTHRRRHPTCVRGASGARRRRPGLRRRLVTAHRPPHLTALLAVSSSLDISAGHRQGVCSV